MLSKMTKDVIFKLKKSPFYLAILTVIRKILSNL